MNNVKISAYTKLRNAVDMGYPFFESIVSMLSFADEVVVVDCGSDDATSGVLDVIACDRPKIKVFHEKEDGDGKIARFSNLDGAQKALARSKCTGNILFQFDCDEIVDEKDSEKIINCCHYVASINKKQIFPIPIIEYWGSQGKIRCDIPFFKPRISMNFPDITHGVPKDCVIIDKDGNKYSKGSDGCDYISTEDGSRIPVNFSLVNKMFENARNSYFHRAIDKNTFIHFYDLFFLKASGMELPLIHHYSWFNMDRKIHNYKFYWGRFWSSMFDEKQGDQNFFFNKPWKDVSEKEISDMAEKIQNETSGWIFHSPINFSEASRFPYITTEDVQLTHPRIMEKWMSDSE